MEQRPADAGAGGVEGARHRFQRRLEGEERGEDANDVVEPGADGAGGDEREQGDRQRDHEGEQRDGAHVARRRPERGARGAEARRAEQDRRQPEAEAAPVEADEDLHPRQHQQGDEQADRDAQADLLGEQGRARDEPAGEPREGVLLALQGERAGDQQQGDEGQGQRRRDGDREDFQRWRGGADRVLVDGDRLRQPVDQGRGDVEVVAGQGGEADHPVELGPPRRRHVGPQRFEDRGGFAQPEDLDRLAEHVEAAPVDDQVQVAAAFLGDLAGDEQVGPRQQRRDPVVDGLRLERVLLVDEHFDFGRFRVQRGERVEPVDQVGGEDQGGEHIAFADLRRGFAAAADVDALDLAADPLVDADRGQLAVAAGDPRAGRDLVEQGDTRLARFARDREADQQRDQDRVGDQQRRLQRRAPQDRQVLEQQPAHQCPRCWR